MRFLFVVAHGRSGSTALQKVLNALPGHCIRGESGGIIRHLALAHHITRGLPERFADASDPAAPWFGAGQVNAAEFGPDLARAFATHILRPPPGTRVAGFKEVRFLPKVETRIGGEPYEAEDGLDDPEFDALMDLLLTGFGPARVVLLSRDPAATAQSGWYRAFDRDQVIARLTACATRFDAAAARDPARVFRLHHAAFAADPEGLRPLLDWLGEDLAPATLAALLKPRLTHAAGIPKRHRKAVKRPIS